MRHAQRISTYLNKNSICFKNPQGHSNNLKYVYYSFIHFYVMYWTKDPDLNLPDWGSTLLWWYVSCVIARPLSLLLSLSLSLDSSIIFNLRPRDVYYNTCIDVLFHGRRCSDKHRSDVASVLKSLAGSLRFGGSSDLITSVYKLTGGTFGNWKLCKFFTGGWLCSCEPPHQLWLAGGCGCVEKVWSLKTLPQSEVIYEVVDSTA